MLRAVLVLGAAGTSALVPDGRPAPAKRNFNSTVINSLIEEWRPRFLDPDLAIIFSNCLPNTLDTTVRAAGRDDSYIVTGDIDAMWLRDSTNQVLPYMQFADQDNDLADLLRGVVMRQVRSVNLDAYANAFNQEPNSHGHPGDQRTPPMTPPVFEGKYELDSLSAVLKSSYYYWNTTKDSTIMEESAWLDGMDTILDTIQVQQRSTEEEAGTPLYAFQRDGGSVYPNHDAANTGMSKCGFRPSDDNTEWPFLVPANAMAVVELTHLASMAQTGGGDRLAQIASRAARLATSIRAGIDAHAQFQNTKFGMVYAYEVDGFGNWSNQDDSNIPSLLSLPYLGYTDTKDEAYVNTRKFLLSADNPYYYVGTVGSGIGSPHTPRDYIWPMSVSIQAITSEDDDEILACLATIKAAAAATGFMHESFDKDDASQFTRSWFSWANALFGELVIKLARERPHLIFKAD